MAGLYPFISGHSFRAGTAGKGKKGDGLLYCPGAFHPVKLLYLHYDLYFYGDLCSGSGDFISSEEGKGVRSHSRQIYAVFPFGRRTGSSGPAAGNLCPSGHRFRKF